MIRCYNGEKHEKYDYFNIPTNSKGFNIDIELDTLDLRHLYNYCFIALRKDVLLSTLPHSPILLAIPAGLQHKLMMGLNFLAHKL